MEDGQLAALIQAIDGIDADRDLCMIMFLCSTGIRVSELVGLDLDDVNYVTQQVKIFGKGHKERSLYLTDELVDALRDWLFTRTEQITKLKTEGVWKPNEDAESQSFPYALLFMLYVLVFPKMRQKCCGLQPFGNPIIKMRAVSPHLFIGCFRNQRGRRSF